MTAECDDSLRHWAIGEDLVWRANEIDDEFSGKIRQFVYGFIVSMHEAAPLIHVDSICDTLLDQRALAEDEATNNPANNVRQGSAATKKELAFRRSASDMAAMISSQYSNSKEATMTRATILK